MALTDEIEKLQQLHAQGALTDEEFGEAKARLIDGIEPAPGATPPDVTQRLDELALQNAILRLDHDWEEQKQRFMIRGHNRRMLPSRRDAVATGVFGVIFAGIMLFVVSLLPNPGPIELLPVLVLLVMIAVAVSRYSKAQEYEAAQRMYLDHRNRLIAGERPHAFNIPRSTQL